MYKILTLSIAALLAGCGGDSDSGGGSNGGSLHVFSSSPNVSVQGNATESTRVIIPVNSRGTTSKKLYFGAFYDSASIQSTYMNITSDSTGNLEVDFIPGYAVGDGQSTHNVSINFCYDEYCNEQVSGSPINASINYNVSLDDEIRMVSAESTINREYNYDDANITDNFTSKEISVTGSNSNSIIFNRGNDSELINKFNVTQRTGYLFDLDLGLKLPGNLLIDTHSKEFKINACYDAECLYPIKGSPLSIPMIYKVNSPLASDDGSIAINAPLAFDFTVNEAEYIQGLDVLVMTSESPENAIYVYDISSNTTEKFALTSYPKNLSVDHSEKQGRIAVSQYYGVFIIDYNKASPSTSFQKLLDSNSSQSNIAVKGDHVYTISTGYNWQALERININTGYIETSNSSEFYGGPILKVTPNGEALYTQDINSSPRSFSKVILDSERWDELPKSDIYHGAYDHGDDFWFDRTGNYYYSQTGDYFFISDFAFMDMAHVGQLPLQEYVNGVGLDETAELKHLFDTGTYLWVIEKHPFNMIRQLQKSNNAEITRYEETTSMIDGINYTEWPFFVFESNNGHIFTLQNAYDGRDIKRTSLLKLQ